MIKDFHQWLEQMKMDEKAARTRLGPTGDQTALNYPPLYHTPIAAGALGKLKANHPNVFKNTNPPPKKK